MESHGKLKLCLLDLFLHTPKQGQKDVIKQLFKIAHILVDTKVLSVELS